MRICGVTEKYSWKLRATRNVFVGHWSAGSAISLIIFTPVWTVSRLENVNNATVENAELSEFFLVNFADLIIKIEWRIGIDLSCFHPSRSQDKNVL